MPRLLSVVAAFFIAMMQGQAHAQTDSSQEGPPPPFEDKFHQLDSLLPTPNSYRTASGAPGPAYWQQKVDYDIQVQIDEDSHRLTGSEVVTYHNNSPDTLRYLWLQLDQNKFRADSAANLTALPRKVDRMSYGTIRMETARDFGGGHNIRAVKDADGRDLSFTIVDTQMRIDLPQPLAPGQRVTFSIDWDYLVPEGKVFRSRSGYEYFQEEDNYIYAIAQWFPRLAAYTDADGWHLKPFLGSAEFTLEFGDYTVAITVPADHIVSATGVLQNPKDVLTETQRRRLAEAADADRPVYIVTPDEAAENEKSKADATKTWVFHAENVRDFAFATSRKFIWDAQGVHQSDGSTVMAMSFYPKEGSPLWDKYSTAAIIQALTVYSRYTFPFPYPVAQSVNSGTSGGIEYPMISFSGGRTEEPDEDGERTYSRRSKYTLISVVIHEVGHNYFPMIVNSDERRWAWMDEGFNTFLEFLAEQEWEENYPSQRGEPRKAVKYMDKLRQPIMTQPDADLSLGNNSYGKTATALVILRETILGRDVFDYAFREYARRWMFKRPKPADFFRTMEDASGVDLDWFWRGWFFSTDYVDLSLDGVTRYTIDTQNPDIEKALERQEKEDEPESLTEMRNRDLERLIDSRPELLDLYNEYDRYTVTEKDRKKYERTLKDLKDWEKEILQRTDNFYAIDISNKGGLVMPVILEIAYEDGSNEEVRMPAEIWRKNPEHITKLLVRDKIISSITLDPHWETTDVDIDNNHFPRKVKTKRLEVYKFRFGGTSRNLMKDLKEERKEKEKEESKGDAPEGAEEDMEDAH